MTFIASGIGSERYKLLSADDPASDTGVSSGDEDDLFDRTNLIA